MVIKEKSNGNTRVHRPHNPIAPQHHRAHALDSTFAWLDMHGLDLKSAICLDVDDEALGTETRHHHAELTNHVFATYYSADVLLAISRCLD